MTDAPLARGPDGSARRLSAVVTGMFDMHNFGDLMFPLVAAHRLAPFGIDVVAASPTGTRTVFADAMPSIPIADIHRPDLAADGVLIGGGYIVHSHRMDLLRTYRTGDCGAWAGPSTWLGATLAASLRDIPIAWNAPGVPHPLAPRIRPLAAAALQAADYVSVRDTGSARMLLAPADIPVAVVPDPVADLQGLWPKPALRAAFGELAERLGLAAGRFAAVHVRRRSLGGESVETFAKHLDAFGEATGLSLLLIGVGSSHGDDVFARNLAQHLRRHAVVLDTPQTLAEIAAAIAHARIYLGSSLHGYVAAAAYEVPGILVARPAYQKFSGFVAHTGRPGDLARDWHEALARAAHGPDVPPPLPGSVRTAHDAHWRCIAEVIRGGSDRRRAQRLAFAAATFAAGVRWTGYHWALAPFVDECDRLAALSGEGVKDLEPL